MNGAELATAVKLLRAEYARGHDDCVATAIRAIVETGELATLEVTVALAVRAMHGISKRPGEDLYRPELYEIGADGVARPLPIDDLRPPVRACLRLAAAGLNRDPDNMRALWAGYVQGDRERGAELLFTALDLAAKSVIAPVSRPTPGGGT